MQVFQCLKIRNFTLILLEDLLDIFVLVETDLSAIKVLDIPH